MGNNTTKTAEIQDIVSSDSWMFDRENSEIGHQAIAEITSGNYLQGIELLTILAYEGDVQARRLLSRLYRDSPHFGQIFGQQECTKRARKWTEKLTSDNSQSS